MTQIDSRPAGRLIPVMTANEDINLNTTTLSLARTAAARGETVLLVDCCGGTLMDQAGIIYNKTLYDVTYHHAPLRDVQYVTSNEHFTAMAAGKMDFGDVLGSLAALSLSYDWVFVGVDKGCTPDHVRLAAAADCCLIGFDTDTDHFMRAYWMIEAIRARHPKFDPLLISCGNVGQAQDSAFLLRDIVHEFLGAPPDYAGHAHFTAPAQIVSRLKAQIAGIRLVA